MARRILLDHTILSLLNHGINSKIFNFFVREKLFSDIDFKNISSTYDINDDFLNELDVKDEQDIGLCR